MYVEVIPIQRESFWGFYHTRIERLDDMDASAFMYTIDRDENFGGFICRFGYLPHFSTTKI